MRLIDPGARERARFFGWLFRHWRHDLTWGPRAVTCHDCRESARPPWEPNPLDGT